MMERTRRARRVCVGRESGHEVAVWRCQQWRLNSGHNNDSMVGRGRVGRIIGWKRKFGGVVEPKSWMRGLGHLEQADDHEMLFRYAGDTTRKSTDRSILLSLIKKKASSLHRYSTIVLQSRCLSSSSQMSRKGLVEG